MEINWPCGLMDKALVFGTKDCRFESCQGHLSFKGILQTAWHAVSDGRFHLPKLLKPLLFPNVIGHLYGMYMQGLDV